MIWPPRPEGHTPDRTGRPNEPWLTREAIGILEKILVPKTKLFEFGSGASTIWYAKRCLFVDAVEHDPVWAQMVSQAIVGDGIRNACVFHESPANGYAAYLACAREALESRGPKFGPYDVVIVDGRERVRSVQIAAPNVPPGGLLVLDNAERERYAEVRIILSGWEVQETSNGLWRTDIYRKPVEKATAALVAGRGLAPRTPGL